MPSPSVRCHFKAALSNSDVECEPKPSVADACVVLSLTRREAVLRGRTRWAGSLWPDVATEGKAMKLP
jgi:hypothetical protein